MCERYINWLSPICTKISALTGNRTHNTLVYEMTRQLTEPPSQGDYSYFLDEKPRCRGCKSKVTQLVSGGAEIWILVCLVPKLWYEWINKWQMGPSILGRKFYLQNLPCMFWVLSSKCLQCLESESAHGKDSAKACSLPAAILWPCPIFMGSSVFEFPILNISLHLVGALADQPRHFRSAVCLSSVQEINQNPQTLSLFPQASTLETPSALLQPS